MRFYLLILLVCFSLLGAEEKRAEMPAEFAIATQAAAIRELYKNDYASKRTDDLVALARKLQGLCANLSAPVERVAMLREAMSVAGRAGDLEIGRACLESLLSTFVVDQDDERLRFWSGFQPLSAEDARSAIDSLLGATAVAIQDDAYPSAVKLATLADQLARRYKLADEQTRTKEMVEQAKSLGTEFAKLSSGDLLGVFTADEHLALGRFLCLSKGDWDQGLPHLATGSDATLKALAEADSAVGNAEDQAEAAGEAWAEWARKQPTKQRAQATNRARVLLRQAADAATGLAKARLEKRLLALGDTGPSVSKVGLRLWFRADKGVITDQDGKVTTWQDRAAKICTRCKTKSSANLWRLNSMANRWCDSMARMIAWLSSAISTNWKA